MIRRTFTIGLIALAGLGVVACGSDSVADKAASNSTPELTLPEGVTLPAGVTLPEVTLPGDLSGDCKAVYSQFLGAMASAMVPGSDVDFDKVFGDAKENVPDDLQDDVDVLSAAMKDFAQVLKDNGNDMTKPEVQQALQDIGTPEVQAASDNIQAYFDETCPQS